MGDEIITVVYKTMDYDKFKKLNNNRRVSARRLANIVKSILEKEIMNPIIVTKEMEIVEGQGRFEAKKSLNKPVYYIVDENATSEDCVRLNKYNQPWEIYDYVYSFADAGNKSYIIFSKLFEDMKMPFARILRFANKGNGHGSTSDFVKEGRLIFTEKDCEIVRDVKDKCDDIISALQFTKRPNEAFYTAVKVISDTKGYDHARMVKKCSKFRNSYAQMANLEEQLKEFSRIYNRETSGKTPRIYFEDYMRNKGRNVRDYGDYHKGYDVSDDVSTLKRNE